MLVVFLRAGDIAVNVVSNFFHVINELGVNTTVVLMGGVSEVKNVSKRFSENFPMLDYHELILRNDDTLSKVLLTTKLLLQKRAPKIAERSHKTLFIGRADFFFKIIAKSECSNLLGDDLTYWALELPVQYAGSSLWTGSILGIGERTTLDASKKVVVPNTERAHFLHERSLVSSAVKFHVLPNFPSFEWIEETRNFSTRVKNSLAPFFCLSGMLNEGRCPTGFLKASIRIFRETRIRLVLAGRANRKFMGRLNKIRAKDEGIRYLGSISQKELLALQEKALFGCAFYYADNENNRLCAPQKVYEYLAQGMPLLVSDNPTLRELVEDNELGVSVKNSDSTSMYNGIKQILESRDALEDNVKEWRRENLTKNAVEKEVKDLVRFIFS